MQLSNIPVQEIQISDRLFQLYHQSPEKVTWEVGAPLYNPVWLQELSVSGYRIIDGFSIIDKISSPNPPLSLPAYVFPEAYSSISLLTLRLLKRLSENNLSIFAIGEIVSQVHKKTDLPLEDFFHVYRALGLGDPARVSRVFLSLLPLKQDLGQFTAIYKLSYNDLVFLSKKKVTDIASLAELLFGFELSGNKLLKLLILIDDIRLVTGMTLKELLEHSLRPKFKESLPFNHRYKLISTFLTQLKYPNRTKHIDQWYQTRKKLDLGQIELIDDLSFEQDYLNLILKPRNLEALKKDIHFLSELAENKHFRALFDFL